jgi:hypothetical protein
MPLSKAAIETLIDTNLADFSNILPTKHREVEHAILDYATNRVIGSGTYTIGDASGTDSVRTISFTDIGTSAYIVTGSLVSNSASSNDDDDVFWMVKNKTSNSFQLLLREVAGVTQNLDFDYVLISK